jgi:hypothetical protein
MHKLSRIANEAYVGLSASCRRISILRVVTKYQPSKLLSLEKIDGENIVNIEY